MARRTCLVILFCLAAGDGRQDSLDPALRAAVDRYFSTQQAEDVEGYLSLWSAKVQRPTVEQIKFVFNAGDDIFSDIVVVKSMVFGELTRVRVSAVRQRTESLIPGRPPVNRQTKMLISLNYVQEAGEWKLVREGPASDDLAVALIDSQSADERQKLLAAEPDLLDDRVLLSIARRGASLAQEGKHPAALVAYSRMLEVARYASNRKYEGEALQNIGNSLLLPAQLRGCARGVSAAPGHRARTGQRRRHRCRTRRDCDHEVQPGRVQRGAVGVPGSTRDPGASG